MNIINRFIKYRLKAGFAQFVILSVTAVIILFVENHFFPRAKILVELNILGRTSAILVALIAFIFFALERKRLYQQKKYPFPWKDFAIFFPLQLITFALFFSFKWLVIKNPFLVDQLFVWLVIIRYLMPLTMVAFLGLAIYGVRFISKFFKSIVLSFTLAFIFFQISLLFKHFWRLFSTLTTVIVNFLLGLGFITHTDLQAGLAPWLQASSFGAYIEWPCAGIESLSLFILLYLFIMVVDRKQINKKRAILAFFFGICGMFLVNVLRIYLLFLSGIFINPHFAIHVFHTNIGWSLFIIYFAIFWLLIYNYLRGPKLKASL